MRLARISRNCSRLANQLELEDGLAIDDAGVQEKLAEFYVRVAGAEIHQVSAA